MNKLLAAISLALLATPCAHPQGMTGDYLDIFIVKVRPEKRADLTRSAAGLPMRIAGRKETFGLQ